MQRAIVGLIVLATLTVPIQSVAQTPPPVPIMPPSLPAAHAVNLMGEALPVIGCGTYVGYSKPQEAHTRLQTYG
jgi:hypothetical protein